MRDNTIHDCSLINLDKFHNINGSMSMIENGKTLPFRIRRVYYLYDVPGGESRGGHAHRALKQLILAVSGSFCVKLDDGSNKISFDLNKPFQGLLIVPGIWREISDFSSGAVCLVMASELYSENDYIRNYEEFLNLKLTHDT